MNSWLKTNGSSIKILLGNGVGEEQRRTEILLVRPQVATRTNQIVLITQEETDTTANKQKEGSTNAPLFLLNNNYSTLSTFAPVILTILSLISARNFTVAVAVAAKNKACIAGILEAKASINNDPT